MAASGSNRNAAFLAFIALLTVLHNVTALNNSNIVICPSSQALCGGSICYDPTTQSCTTNGSVIQCIAACGSQCYTPSTQQCFNGTVCLLTQQLCLVKYDSYFGYPYSPPSYQCYYPTSQACYNNTLCSYPYRSCNHQCLLYNQMCANNNTVCNVTAGTYYYSYAIDQYKLCNGVCYDSFSQKCVNGVVQCINNCSGVCYNSSTQQCFNGTVCALNQQLCVVKYDSYFGYPYSPPSYQCYYPTSQACYNNTLCSYPYRSCNQQCLLYNQMCANNSTVCNVTAGTYYYSYQTDEYKLCDRQCYDSFSQRCVNGVVQCINNCSGVCYNSSTQQCFNGTVCPLNQQLCVVKYDSYFGYPYSPPSYQCYDPTYQACYNNTLCSYPYRSCNQQCLLYNQVCASNNTVCNVTAGTYYYIYQTDQYKLCNGVCYDSAVQQCIGGYAVSCIRDPSTQQCINQTTSTPQLQITTSPTPSASSGCCAVKVCSTDADCCVQGSECQCFRSNSQTSGVCLNPFEQPICAKGCPAQQQCRNYTDCCKCQCGQVTVTNVNGTVLTKSQCVPR